MDYVRINSVDDIDPHRISIRKINLRYIDRDGNRFATRFNFTTRSIEIVRLASSREEALTLRRQVIQDRRNRHLSELEDVLNDPEPMPGSREWPVTVRSEPSPDYPLSDDPASSFSPDPFAIASASEDSRSSFDGDGHSDSDDESHGDAAALHSAGKTSATVPASPPAHPSVHGAVPIPHPFEEKDHGYNPYTDDFHFDEAHNLHGDGAPNVTEEIFYESSFIDETIQELQKVRNRQHAIISNMKRTGYFETHHSVDFHELIRAFDVECWQPTEKAINFHKELFTFPRPANYYIARMTDIRKLKIESMDDPVRKMEQIRRYEMQDTFQTVYEKIERVTTKMLSFLKQLPETDRNNLSGASQIFLRDAETLCSLLVDEAKDRLRRVQIWRKRYA